MRINLINTPNLSISPIVQILLNRGMAKEKIHNFLTSTIEKDVIDPVAGFGSELLNQGASLLISCIANNGKAFIIVDSDVDGLTSSAILINYLYELFPSWVENNLSWGFHKGKQHGIPDFLDEIIEKKYDLLICPDSATNDTEQIDILYSKGCKTLILDHHLSDVPMSDNAVIINSQYNYPNSELSGAGVVWQFCKFLDNKLNKNIVNNYIDLCALGLTADMMNIQSIETKTLIFEGFKEKNIKNPFIAGIIEKNEYSFSKADYKPSRENELMVSPIGAAFFAIPLLNAICRSGTMEEKELIFDSMLNHRAFIYIPSTKRGHKLGETEQIVTQALRTVTNVKNRQTRAETAALELFEEKIKENNLLEHKVLLLLLKPGEVDRNVAGLIANKLASKYQRPCCVLTKVTKYEDEELPWDEPTSEPIITYEGSMRGYTRTGVESFKDIAEASEGCIYVRGHDNAAGLGLEASSINAFIRDTDRQLASISTEPVYYVDYIFEGDSVDANIVLQLADMNDYIGTGFERPAIYIQNLETSENTVHVYKNNTVKIDTPSGVPLMKFGITDEEIADLKSGVILNAVCKANANEWNFEINPQLMIDDMEYKPKQKSITESWGF